MECLVAPVEIWTDTILKYDFKFGYRKDGEIVGVIGLTRAGNKNLIASRLFVKEEYRCQGIGSLLLQYSLEVAREEQCRLVLYVDKGEPVTECLRAFYSKRGLTEAGPEQAAEWHISFDREWDFLFYAI